MTEDFFSPGLRAFFDNPGNGIFIVLFIGVVIWLVHQLTHQPGRKGNDGGGGWYDGDCGGGADGGGD